MTSLINDHNYDFNDIKYEYDNVDNDWSFGGDNHYYMTSTT
jgi:hypothetical protein